LAMALPGDVPANRKTSTAGRSIYGFDIDDQPLFADVNDISLRTRAHTFVSLASEVTTLPEEAGGWVDVRPEVHWSFAPRHELALEIPYRESDLDVLGGFKRGLGDIRAFYKLNLHQPADATDLWQGSALRLGVFFPSGDPDVALGSDVFMLAPTIATAIGGMEGNLGAFPTLAYLHSLGSTTARAVPTEDLYRTGLPVYGREDRIRSLMFEVPVQYRFAQRWTVGLTPAVSHEFTRGDTSLMLGGHVGLKISEQSSFRFDYAEYVAGHEVLSARLRLLVALSF